MLNAAGFMHNLQGNDKLTGRVARHFKVQNTGNTKKWRRVILGDLMLISLFAFRSQSAKMQS